MMPPVESHTPSRQLVRGSMRKGLGFFIESITPVDLKEVESGIWYDEEHAARAAAALRGLGLCVRRKPQAPKCTKSATPDVELIRATTPEPIQLFFRGCVFRHHDIEKGLIHRSIRLYIYSFRGE